MNDKVIVGYTPKVIYKVLETRDMTGESSNGYFWYRVEDGVWCAYGKNSDGGEWLTVLPIERPV